MNQSNAKRIAAVAVLLLAGCAAAMSQNFQGTNTLQNIASEGQGVGKYIVNIAFVFTGIIAAIELIPAAIKGLKGDPNAKDSIINVGIGAIAAFILLAVIKAVMGF